MFKSRKQKRWTAWLLTLFMTFSVMSQGLTQTALAATGDKVFDIIEITDFHGTLLDSSKNQVGAVLADRIQKIKASNANTIVIGGGDLYQGSAVSNMLHGVPVQKVMSKIGMEVTALGNHEFDWGLETITTETMKDASYSIVCSNVYDTTSGNRKFEPYKVITKDGVRIAFVGAISEETPTIVSPNVFKNLEVRPVATEINNVAKEIKDGNKADVIIAVIHEGNNGDNVTSGKIVDIANALNKENVSAVFGGHSHTELHFTATNGLPVYIGKSNGKGFIDAKMTVSADKKVSFPAPSAADYKALDNADGYKTATPIVNAEVKQIIDAAVAEVAPISDEVIGKTSTALNRVQITSQGNPSGTYGSSILGNWAADATRASINAEVGMQNNGGLRIDIPTGNITVGTMWQFMPFDNTVYKLSMTKAQIKAVLEQAVADGGKGIQVSGIKFTYDSTEPTGKRVFDITRENGDAINDSEVLTAAVPDFLATGGDGFTAFKEAGGINPANDTHLVIRDVLISNVKTHKTEDPSIQTSTVNRITNLAKVISMVATSDVHGTVYPYDYATGKPADQGLAKVAGYVGKLRDGNPNVILADAGDTIQGTPFSYYYDKIDTKTEYPMMQVMGAMKYDTWTLGNHEFNYGLDVLNRIINDAKKENIHVLSANTYKTVDNSNFVEPYIIKTFTVNGVTHKVGVLGMTTKTIPSWENADNYKGLQFNDLVDQAKLWVPKMKAAGAEIVIATIHSGEESANDTIPENQIKAVATGVSGIDAIVAGHAHSLYAEHKYTNPDKKTVVVTEPGKNAQNISQIDISVKADGSFGGIVTKNVKMDSTVTADDGILKLAQPYQDQTLAYVDTVIGKATAAYSGANQTFAPNALMDLINKVQMEGAGTQLSIAAPLSAAAAIPAGDVKIKDLNSVYVFENFLYGVKMNGKQIKDWMEYSARYYQQVAASTDATAKDTKANIPDYNLDILYGASYDVDLTQPACTLDQGRVAVQGTGRIKNLKFNGKLVKDTDVFTVAINNYRYNGGGGFVKAAGLTIKDANGKDIVDPSLVTYDSQKTLGDDGQVRSMMIKYVQDHKTITPEVSNNWKLYTTAVEQQVEATEIKLDKTSIALEAGKTETLIATVLPEKAINKNVTWTSSDNSIATVKDGVVTAVKAGKVTITASIGDVKAECTVEVKAASVPVDNNNGNNSGSTTDTTKPVQVVNDTTKVVDAIKTAPEKSTVVVDAKNNATASKDIFTSIKGKDVNVTFQGDGISWTFNGKDIDPTLIKDIDLSLKTVSADLKTKEAAKVKAVVGKDVAIVPFSFTYDGKLPGKATVKVFIGKDWANASVYVNRYYADKNTYEIVQEATVDADGYMTFTTDHCSDYFVMAKSAAPNLPKTGSPIDMNVVVGMGSLVALLGAALFISGRKREENDIAA